MASITYRKRNLMKLYVIPELNKVHLTAEWKKVVRTRVEKAMGSVRNKFIQSFLNHPISREIDMGPSGYNLSGTLKGYSNLFGFIGFYEDEKPIKVLKAILMEYEIKIVSRNGYTDVKIDVPTKEEIYKATPLPWARGRSWVKSMETGLSGFGMYITSEHPESRSGEGIQTKRKIRSGKFTNTSYLSVLLNEYYKNIKNLEDRYTK
jgi:hypothetical protein